MNIGTLTGQLALEDQLSGALTLAADKVKTFAQDFDNMFGAMAVTAGVFAAAVAGAAISIVALGEKGSDINDVTQTLDHFAGSAENAAEIMSKMREGVKGTVDDFALAKDASRLLSAGVQLTAEQFGTLTQASFVLQNRGLGSTKEMMDLVSSAMITGRTRALAMKLGVVEVKDTTEEFAKSLGVEVSQLSAAGVAEGKRIGIMKMLEAANKDAGDQQRDFGEQIEFAEAKLKNWVDGLASAVAASPNVMKAVEAIGEAFNRIFGDGKPAMDAIVSGVNLFADAVTATVPYVESFAAALRDAWDVFKLISPALEVAAAGLVGYGTALVLTEGYTVAAEAVTAAYAVTMGLLSGAITLTTGSLSSFGVVLGTFMAAYKLGEWLEENTKWARELSDAFEYAALRLQGFSAADADAAIAQDHAAEAEKKRIESVKSLTDSLGFVGPILSKGTQLTEADTAAKDRARFVTDKLTESQAKNADAWADLSTLGATWQETLTGIDAKTIALAEDYLKWGASSEKVAAALELTDEQVKAISKSVEYQKTLLETMRSLDGQWAEERIKSLKSIESAEKQLADMVHKSVLDETSYKILKAWEAADEAEKAFLEMGGHTEEEVRRYNAAVEGIATETAQEARDAADAVSTATTKMADSVATAMDKADSKTAQFKNTVYLFAQDLASLNSELSAFYDSLNVAGGVGSLAGGTGVGLMGLGAAGLLPRVNGMGTSFGGGQSIQSQLETLPHHARGGPYEPGPQVVGEEGPEVVVPDDSGVIIPNDVLRKGGDSPIHQYITVSGIWDMRSKRELADAVSAVQLQKSGRKF